MNKYTPEYITTNFGTVNLITSKELVAGSFGKIKIQIIIGKFGIDDGGHIKIAWPVSNSFGIPQFEEPCTENYSSVNLSSNAKYEVKFEFNGYIRPFMPCITIKIFDGFLNERDVVILELGDQSHGSLGFRSQTYVEKNIEFRILMDPFGTNDYIRLPDSPLINIISDRPANLTAILSSVCTINSSTWLVVRADDKWGNLAQKYLDKIRIIGPSGITKEYKFIIEDYGVKRFEDIKFEQLGYHSIVVEDEENGFKCESNPIVVRSENPDLNLYWGDLHGQTGETVGSGTIEEYFHFGFHVAAIDFISHAANAFQVTKEIWKLLQDTVKRYHMPYRFVTFLGYEWSGNPGAGGDHNVYYLNDDQPIHRCSHTLIDDISDLETDRYPVSELYKEFTGRDDVLIIPHIGGRKASLDIIDEDLSPFIEIMSVHGHFEWFAHESIDRNLRVGFIASSDTHSCRPGATFPVSKIEAVRSGLTAVYTKELTRMGLWEAFRKRHVYGTTGSRIILKFNCGSAMMGDEIEIVSPPIFIVEVIGTNGIEKVELIKDKDLLYSHPINIGDYDENAIAIRWSGARVKTRKRNTDWSGKIVVENGSIIEAKEFAFDLPFEGIYELTSTSVSFKSTTAGDFDGIKLIIKGNENTKIAFSSTPASFEFLLKDLDELIEIDAGLIEQKVQAYRLSKIKLPNYVNFEYTDNSNIDGCTPYYVRVLLSDGEKAWSSPIFITM